MSNKAVVKKILEHPDKEELLSKLLLQIDPKDIAEWLDAKYQTVGEKKFVLGEKALKTFRDDYLDIYNLVQEDLALTKASSSDPSMEMSETIQNLPAYKEILVKTANQELDIRTSLKVLANAIETRMSQVFDQIQEDPTMINTRVDNLLINYAELFGNLLEKYYKFTETTEVAQVNNNITVQVFDKHMVVFYEIIREAIAELNLENSMKFMEIISSKLENVKMSEKDALAPAPIRLAEAQVLNEQIMQRLDE